jgi:hypothetical protein
MARSRGARACGGKRGTGGCDDDEEEEEVECSVSLLL